MLIPSRTRLGLGTVQLGLPYGKHAAQELMPEADAFAILARAVAAGIDFYDTAAAYGVSEARLGRFGLAQKAPQGAVISSKIPRLETAVWQDPKTYAEAVLRCARESLERLGMRAFELLQFHQCDVPFLTSPSAARAMSELLHTGLCRTIGVSVYHPEEAIAAAALPQVGALQIPLNLLDRRFVAPKLLDLYRSRRMFIVARSVFLQGVLTGTSAGDALPPVKRAAELGSLRERARAVTAAGDISLADAARRYVFADLVGTIDVALLGIDTVGDLDDNLRFIASAQPLPYGLRAELEALSVDAAASGLLDPSRWNA